MPEGDVVWRTAKALHHALAGRPLVGVDLRWPGVAGEGLRGRHTVDVVPRGKHLLHRVEGGTTIHSHLRMDGSWRVVPLQRITPRYARHPDIRAIVASPDQAAVGWSLGRLDVIPTDRESDLVGHLGPDLLGPDWDEDLAVANLAAEPDRAIGAALLDQRNLAGLGTIYTGEPLWVQRVNPITPVGEVPDDVLRAVLRTALESMTAAIRSRTGLIEHPIHGRSGYPCPRCGSIMTKATVGEAPQDRTLTYCPACQVG